MAEKKKRLEPPPPPPPPHGATKHLLSEVEKVLLGKGLYVTYKPPAPTARSKKEDQ